MATQEDPTWLTAWKRLLHTHASLVRVLEAEMLARHDLPLAWFDVLSRLEPAAEHRMRMQDLADSVWLTRSGLTRLIDRMADAGLVCRAPDPSDRRGMYAVLSEDGLAKLDQVWPSHIETVRRHFGCHLTATDAQALAQALAKVLGGQQSTGPDRRPEPPDERGPPRG